MRKTLRPRIKAGSLLLHIAVSATFLGCACCNNINRPKSDGEWPKPHDGIYISENDTLFFNGDGKSVSWHFAQKIEDFIPQGKGKYAFLFDKGLWRYDQAERLDISTEDGKRISLMLDVPGSCTESSISIIRFDNTGKEGRKQTFKLTSQRE